MKRAYIVLFAIVLLSALLRFWQLGTIPPSPDWDEAALGYNAYSILLTGKDEYGKSFPLILQSFNDYKPALYIYLIVPFLLLFDLTVLAVRMPSALSGIASVVLMFFLVKELLKKDSIALFAAFILAVSPVAIHFSHVAFEANVGLLCNMAIVFLFLKGLKRPWLLVVAAVFAGLNFYIYQSERIFTPILVLALAVIFFVTLRKISRKYLLLAFVLGMIVVLPFIFAIFQDKNTLVRAQGVSLFVNSSKLLEPTINRLDDDKKRGDVVGLIFDNRRIEFAKIIFSNYLSHFDTNWLFLSGDKNLRHQAPGVGHLLLIELPFLLIGIYQLLFGVFEKRVKYLIFSWILLSPIPASVTIEVPHVVRTLNMFPPIFILIGLGVYTVIIYFIRVKHLLLGKMAITFIAILFFSNFAYFLNQYFVQLSYFTAASWQYGYKDLVSYAEKVKPMYDHIVVANAGQFDQSYIFFLFYTKYPPRQYQEEVKKHLTTLPNRSFDKYEFKTFTPKELRQLPLTLFITGVDEFSKDGITQHVVYYPSGRPAIKVIGEK